MLNVEMAVDAKNHSEEVDAQMEEDDGGNETADEDLPPEPRTKPEPDVQFSNRA
jgi:hypothetical protein